MSRPQERTIFAECQWRSLLAFTTGLGGIFVVNRFRSSLHLNGQCGPTSDGRGWDLLDSIQPQSKYFTRVKEYNDPEVRSSWEDYLNTSLSSLVFMAACFLYAISAVYLAREHQYRYSLFVRRSSILLALLVCLIVQPRSHILGGFLYQYLPLATLTAELCNKYLSSGMREQHCVPQRPK